MSKHDSGVFHVDWLMAGVLMGITGAGYHMNMGIIGPSPMVTSMKSTHGSVPFKNSVIRTGYSSFKLNDIKENVLNTFWRYHPPLSP